MTTTTKLLENTVNMNQKLVNELTINHPKVALEIILDLVSDDSIESLRLGHVMLTNYLERKIGLEKPKTVKKPKPKTVKKPHPTFTRLQPSQALSVVIEFTKPLTRTEAVKRIWEYIRKHNLQDKTNKRNIKCDEKMKAVTGKDVVTMFELAALIGTHLK